MQIRWDETPVPVANASLEIGRGSASSRFKRRSGARFYCVIASSPSRWKGVVPAEDVQELFELVGNSSEQCIRQRDGADDRLDFLDVAFQKKRREPFDHSRS
jgi:hypothetical protein